VYPELADCEITLIGVEPKTVELSRDLSKEVAESIAGVTRLVFEETSLCRSSQEYAGKS